MARRTILLAALLMACAGSADDGGLEPQESYNAWHFRIGPVMSPRVRVEVNGPRLSVPLTQRTSVKSSSGTSGSVPADPSEGYVERQYADGYVKPDRGTEDPDSIVSGLTWDWGADNVQSQYSNKKMEFHTDAARWSESVSSSSFSSDFASGYESDRDFLVGVEAMGGWTFWNNRTFDAAVDAGFRFYGSGYLDAESKYSYGTSVTTTRKEYRFVDSYDASGWTGDVPEGPYTGTADGPGRLIGATPTRREELVNSSSSTREEYYSYSGDTRLIYRIWDLRLGPTLGWHVTDWFALRGGVYGLLGLVDASLKTDSGLSDASSSTCEAVFGMAFGLSAQVNFTDSIFLYGGAEYDWWTDSVDLNAGGANAEIELSDLVISIGLGVEF